MAKSLQYLLYYPPEGQHRGRGAVFGEESNAALRFVSHMGGGFFQSRNCAVTGEIIYKR